MQRGGGQHVSDHGAADRPAEALLGSQHAHRGTCGSARAVTASAFPMGTRRSNTKPASGASTPPRKAPRIETNQKASQTSGNPPGPSTMRPTTARSTGAIVAPRVAPIAMRETNAAAERHGSMRESRLDGGANGGGSAERNFRRSLAAVSEIRRVMNGRRARKSSEGRTASRPRFPAPVARCT